MQLINRFRHFIKLYHIELLIFLFFIFTRLPSLGHDNFNTDVWKWKARSYDFGSGIFNFQPLKTIQKYHPGVTLMWVGTISVKITNLIYDATHISPFSVAAVFLLDRIQKILLVAAIGTLLTLMYILLKKITNTRLALLAVMLINLEPFFVGLSRVFHLEGFMSVAMLVSILSLYVYITQHHQRKYLVLSAVTAALAALTKTSAIFLFPFTVWALMFFDKDNARIWSVQRSKVIAIWVFVFALVCMILWPAVWYAPLEVLNTLYKGIFVVGIDTEHYQYYFDKYVDNPGMLFYMVVLGFKSSLFLVPGLLGLFFTWKSYSTRSKHLIFFILNFFILFYIELALPSKKLDRYILPGLLSLSIITVFFYDHMFTMASKWTKSVHHSSYLYYLLVVMQLFIGLLVLAGVHPDYFSYYSPYLGGLANGVHVLEPKWMIGSREVLSYFDKKAKENNFLPADETSSFEELVSTGAVAKILTVGFQEKYYTQIWPFFREKNAWAVVQDLSPFATKTRYFVYPVWDDSGASETRFQLKQIDPIYVRGVKIYNVYERVDVWTN